jgi:two-component system cell cycle sensor histidine kinase/response regulator CckA
VARDGRILGGIGLVEDVTERREAEEGLRRSEEKSRNILETIADGYHEVDLNGIMTLANDSLCETLGYSRDELMGLSYRQLMDAENAQQIFDAYNEVFRTGRSNPGFATYQIIRKDATTRHVSVSIALMKDADGNPTGFRGILRDVTERKLLEEQLRQAVKMEAIGQLAGGVAHDFNNLLTAMMGYAHILEQQLPEEPSHRQKLEQITKAAERAASLTQQLLAFGRKQFLDTKPLDLNESVRDLEPMLRRLIGENVEIRTVLDLQLPTVEADASQIDQILLNLAVNARDAMPTGGTLTIETAGVFLDSDYALGRPEVIPGAYAMLAVKDTGRGMDSETVNHIFDPFFTTKDKAVGTGLGLSTVYGIVKQHNGNITVSSKPNQGSTFRIYLPQTDRVSDTSLKSPGTQVRPRGNETVLVVEDEEAVRGLACDALELLGYIPLAASDPGEAISISGRHQGHIHLLLTDVVLPKMDGRSLFNHLSKERPDMRVLFMSGYTEDFIVHHGVLDSGLHFVKKPFSVDRLGQKIREVLDEPRHSVT